jgi:hypothetical protein
VPRAYEDERGLRRQKNDRKGAYKGKKRGRPTKVKMKGIDPEKFFGSANIKKMLRAYESLDPALGAWGGDDHR